MPTSSGPLVSICPGQAAPLTYFRNNILHLLTLPALIAARPSPTAAPATRPSLRRLVSLTYPYLQAELFLDDAGVGRGARPDARRARRATGSSSGARTGEAGSGRRAGSSEAVSLMRLAQVVIAGTRARLPLRIPARPVPGGHDRARDTRDAVPARRRPALATTHGRDAADLYDKSLFKVFIHALETHGLITVEGTRLQATPVMRELEQEARTLLGEQVRHAILTAVVACGADDPKAA